MSLKIHFFYLYPGLFPANLGAVSDEQGERFHQVLKIFGDIHKGFWDAGILEDYSWSVLKETDQEKYKISVNMLSIPEIYEKKKPIKNI